MSVLQGNDFVSIIMCHYGLADDFGEVRAAPHIQRGETRSDMMKRSLSSLIGNTSYPAEIIVVDNGPDGSNDHEFILSQRVNTYVRNRENMYFGWAWDQGAALATGDYLCFTCNDILFHEAWLDVCMDFHFQHPYGKYITTPIITPDKDNDKYNRGYKLGYRLNTLAGSNCMVMHKRTYEEIGPFGTGKIAGTKWHQKMHKAGYMIAATPNNMADHLAHLGGVDFQKDIKVKKTLLDGTVIKL